MSGNAELTRSLAAVRSLFDAAACSCALASADGASLVFVAADGGSADIVGVELPVGRGLVGWAAMSGQPLSVSDVASDSRFARDVAEAIDYQPQAILAAPFFDPRGEVLGVLEVLDPGVGVTGDWPLAVLGTLAALLGPIAAAGPSGADDSLADLGRRVVALVEGRDR